MRKKPAQNAPLLLKNIVEQNEATKRNDALV